MLNDFAPRFPVAGKVRCGVKENGRAKSVDYFVSADADFNRLHPGQPRELDIIFPYDTGAECFHTNLEWWAGTVSACYSDDAKTAHRKAEPGSLVFSARATRRPIPCPAQECAEFKAGKCRMTGRLYFWLASNPRRDSVYQLDTRGMASVQRLGAAMRGLGLTGSLFGRHALLRVEMHKTGSKHFPVVSLGFSEPSEQSTPAPAADERERLLAAFEQLGVDPRKPEIAEWVKRVGIPAALEQALVRLGSQS